MNFSTLPSSPLFIIQGNYQKIPLLENTSPVIWINCKSKDLFQKQEISSKSFIKFINTSYNHKIIPESVFRTLISLPDILAQTNHFLSKESEIRNILRNFIRFYDYLELIDERKNLEHELKWAGYLESQSKTNVGMKRLQKLNEELEELEKKKEIIEPQHNFLKHTEEDYKDTLEMLTEEIKQLNNSYIVHTTQTNKLKRQIDTQKPKLDLYIEKLEEMKSKIPGSEIESNKDYIRIKNKLETVKNAIKTYNNESQAISTILSEEKNRLKILKQKLRKIQQDHNRTSSNFTEIDQTYQELMRSIEENESKKNILLRNQMNAKETTIMGTPPEHVRFSSLIEDELRSNTIKISEFLDLSNTPIKDLAVKYTKSLESLDSLLATILKDHNMVSEDNMIQFREFLNKLESHLNPILHIAELKMNFENIPLVEREGAKIPDFGINFTLQKNNKPIRFDRLSPEEKLFVLWSFEFVLNTFAGFSTHVFPDTNYKIKKNQSLIENLIKLIQNGIIRHHPEHKLVILLNRPILEDTIRQDLVITTIKS